MDSETRVPTIIAVVLILLCFSITMVGLRVLSRSLIGEFGLDDAFAVLSVVSATPAIDTDQTY